MKARRDLEAQKRAKNLKDKSGNDGLLHHGLKHEGYFQGKPKQTFKR